jgi:hypothetical protein
MVKRGVNREARSIRAFYPDSQSRIQNRKSDHPSHFSKSTASSGVSTPMVGSAVIPQAIS